MIIFWILENFHKNKFKFKSRKRFWHNTHHNHKTWKIFVSNISAFFLKMLVSKHFCPDFYEICLWGQKTKNQRYFHICPHNRTWCTVFTSILYIDSWKTPLLWRASAFSHPTHTHSDETGIFQYRLGLYPAVYEGSKYHSQRKRKTLRIAELIIFVFVHFSKALW